MFAFEFRFILTSFIKAVLKKSEVFGNVFLPKNLSCYYDWCNENFINASASVFKKDIYKKVLRDAHGGSTCLLHPIRQKCCTKKLID